MATFLFVPYFQSTQLALSSQKQLLLQRLAIALAIAIILSLSLALLLPCILPFLLSLLPPLPPCPIFLSANLLILAIVFSSASSYSSSPPPSNSLPDSYDFSRSYIPSEFDLQPVPRHRSPKSNPKLYRRPQRLLDGSELPVSDHRSTPLARVRRSPLRKLDVMPISSQPVLAESFPTDLQNPGALVSDSGRKQTAIASRPLNELREKKIGRKEDGVAAGNRTRIVRSKSDQRICAPAATPMKTLRRVETMNDVSMVLRPRCDEKSSQSNVMSVPPIESLSDDDLNKRCAEFIAKSRAKMKKESLDVAD